MQKIATRVFIYSSIAFGIMGILVIWTLPAGGDGNASALHTLFMELLFTTVVIILPSFALSVASKYLSGKEDGHSQ